MKTITTTLTMLTLAGTVCGQTAEMLPTLGGTSSMAEDINNNGEICGYSTTAGDLGLEATVWTNGSADSLGVPGLYSFSYANAINDNGEVAGYVETGTVPGDFNNQKSAFFWGLNGSNVNIGMGLGTGTFSIAYDINNNGVVVGQGQPSPTETRGFAWNLLFGATFAGADPIYNFGANFGTNDSNDLVGYAAAGFDGGQPIYAPFDPIAGGWSTGIEIGVPAVRDPQSANAISNSGIVVGQSGDGRDHVFEACRYTLDPRDPVVWLGTLPGFDDSNTRDVNSDGIIVGSAYRFSDNRFHATAWVNDVPVDLNDYLPNDGTWAYLDTATGINERGDIVGFGYTPAGDVRGFVLRGFGAEPCVADTNGDGLVTPADFNAWVLAFNNQAPECDQNDDGLCTPADFNAWILNFNAGC